VTRRASRRLHLIAFRVREEFEKDRKDPVKWKPFGYPIDSTLGGLCGFASDRLVAVARRAGFSRIRTVTSADGGHIFVRWTQGRHEWIVDVTATQFNNRRPRVCMLRVTSNTRLPHYWREE